MRGAKVFVKAMIGFLVLSVLFGMWYKNKYAMGIASSYSVNTPEMSHSLLVLTQGSDYKNAVVEKVVNYYSSRDFFIQVQDLTQLPDLDIDDWTVVLLIHTWEIERAPKEVIEMIEKNVNLSKIAFFTTSGNGDGHVKGIDGITGASIMENVNDKSQEAIDSVNSRWDYTR